MKKFILAVLAMMVLIASHAFAMDLASAKQIGYVGEKQDGLIGAVVPNPSPDVQVLIAETNRGRMAVYQDTAGKQGVSVVQVQTLAAEKLFNMAAPGQFIQQNGQWVKK